MRKITQYTWHTGKLTKPLRLLVVSDLHNKKFADILPHLHTADVLLLPGDLVIKYASSHHRGIAFLREAAKILPTYFGVGNHEVRMDAPDVFEKQVRDTGAKFLFNTYERFGELVIGCWYRPHKYGNEDMLSRFQAESGCRVLMSHRPEDYYRYLSDKDMDLVLSGHAHGGQVRLFGHGLFAPGQGLFPKFTKGVEGHMIISAGAGDHVPVPRVNNPREILLIDLD